jgi:peptidoglycan/xylan/chitin deacetylase (PgdA/CDA1 family)
MPGVRTVGLILLGATVAGIGAVLWSVPDWVLDQLAKHYPGCVYRVATQKPLLALTLDDGPDPETTPEILRELQRHGARATFFLIASRLQGQEDLVRAIVKGGHELGNHFTLDRRSITLDSVEFKEDLLAAHQSLAAFAQVRWARPGSGWYSQQMIKVMEQNGYQCALGSVYPFDVAISSVSWATRYILRVARPGGIVVLHEGGARGRRTAQTLARVIPELQRRGYRIVSLRELVAAGSPHPRRKAVTTRANARGVL